jgi:hypothetical protein
MNAKQFLDLYGKERAIEVCKKAGTSYAYFNQIAYGHRRPSVKLAQKLVAASKNDLDFVALLTSNTQAA